MTYYLLGGPDQFQSAPFAQKSFKTVAFWHIVSNGFCHGLTVQFTKEWGNCFQYWEFLNVLECSPLPYSGPFKEQVCSTGTQRHSFLRSHFGFSCHVVQHQPCSSPLPQPLSGIGRTSQHSFSHRDTIFRSQILLPSSIEPCPPPTIQEANRSAQLVFSCVAGCWDKATGPPREADAGCCLLWALLNHPHS